MTSAQWCPAGQVAPPACRQLLIGAVQEIEEGSVQLLVQHNHQVNSSASAVPTSVQRLSAPGLKSIADAFCSLTRPSLDHLLAAALDNNTIGSAQTVKHGPGGERSSASKRSKWTAQGCPRSNCRITDPPVLTSLKAERQEHWCGLEK